MHRTLETAAGVILILVLAASAQAAVTRWGLPVPGAALGLAAYLLLLATGRCDWSMRGADLLAGLIGAMIVPAMIGLALSAEVLLPVLGKVALILLASTGATALATVMLFRLAGGRG